MGKFARRWQQYCNIRNRNCDAVARDDVDDHEKEDENGEVKIKRRNAILTTNLVSMWLIFTITLLGFTRDVFGVVAVAAENNLQYKEYWYKTEQLCPDLQESVAGKDIDTANLPYKSVFHFQSVSESCADLPCILETNGPQRLVSTALIEAIHVDNRPWNYSGSQTCEEHIKLRLPEPSFLKMSNVPKIICRIPKSKSGSKESTGSLFHPYVWQFQKGKLGLSFSSFNLSHLPQQIGHTVSGNQTQQGNSYWLDPDPKGNQFVQIVFTTRFGGMCTLRVQQYLLDAHKTLCEGVQQRSPFQLCGLYECSEKESILRTLGFWTHRKQHDDIQRWCREDPTYLEILVSTLRALIMPLLFISVFYVTRRLRLKLASRQNGSSRAGVLDRHRGVLRQRQCYLRSLMREGGNNNSPSESSEHMLRPSLILNHVVYDIPVNGEYPGYDDLPPPYETIVQPPSYLEATNIVKSSSSPVATTSPSTDPTTLSNESISSTHNTNPSSVGDYFVDASTSSCDAASNIIVPETEGQSNDNDDEETVHLLRQPRQQSSSHHHPHSSASSSNLHLPT